jgi:hypothetical protein
VENTGTLFVKRVLGYSPSIGFWIRRGVMFIHATEILGFFGLFFLFFTFATWFVLSDTLVSGFWTCLEIIDELAVTVGMLSLASK